MASRWVERAARFTRQGRVRGQRGDPAVALTRGGGGFANVETTALIARFTSAPSAPRAALIDTTITAAKAAGVWQLCDAFYMVAAHDAQAARQNWKGNVYNLTVNGSPTFTADRGYAGDGAAAYLDTGFNPSTAGGLLTQNSAHISLWNRTVRAADGTIQMGARKAASAFLDIGTRFTGNIVVERTNSATGSISNNSSNGHFIANRSTSTAVQGYRNGASLLSTTPASTALINANLLILASAVESSTPILFSSDEIAAASIGASLTAQQMADFYNLVTLPWMTAVGA